MNIEEEQKYEDTIEEIIFQLENLIVEMMLNSIKRVKSSYDQMLTACVNQDDDGQF
jgi:hypothetical protein